MSHSKELDAHEKPPAILRSTYKKYQKHSERLDSDPEVVDFERGLTIQQQTDVRIIRSLPKQSLELAVNNFLLGKCSSNGNRSGPVTGTDIPIYEHSLMPGWPFRIVLSCQ